MLGQYFGFGVTDTFSAIPHYYPFLAGTGDAAEAYITGRGDRKCGAPVSIEYCLFDEAKFLLVDLIGITVDGGR